MARAEEFKASDYSEYFRIQPSSLAVGLSSASADISRPGLRPLLSKALKEDREDSVPRDKFFYETSHQGANKHESESLMDNGNKGG